MEMDDAELTESQFIIKCEDDLKQEVKESRELLGGAAAAFLTPWIQQNSLVAAVLARSDGKIPKAIIDTDSDLSTDDVSTVSSPSGFGESGENNLTAVDFVAHAFSAREQLCAKHQKDICIQVVAETASSPPLLFSTAAKSSDYSKLSRHKGILCLSVCVRAAHKEIMTQGFCPPRIDPTKTKPWTLILLRGWCQFCDTQLQRRGNWHKREFC
jgi:hypothetical protein